MGCMTMATDTLCACPARRQIALLFWTCAALTLLWTMSPAKADSLRCAGGNFIVNGASPAELDTVCAAAADTIRFMGSHGFEVAGVFTTVEVVPAIRLKTFASALGAFDGELNHIELLSYEATLRQLLNGQVLGVSMTPELYRSFIVHEMAHAVARVNFKRRPVVSAHEYIAYTVQLATMSDELRGRILDSVDTEAYDHLGEVSDMLLMLDPHRFAVKSYLHYFRPENRASAFQQLLTGKF